ncbi:hypothetical protein [Streptomyces hoynatensis]|uniref:TPR repeat domain-containing protein n=1 Tax=Streptomyces hoynatensis TaxID=1141874 RepID=A0A3A9ZBB2_9ACTN|nr:hypothetical protein [Streptomyces hoynatensis]RKN45611.1 hypothetical protein D7294_03820 [Streptomyces hoynatensis]
MPNFSFTRQEVEAKAGVKPWTLQEQFTAEIKPEDMGNTAALYARAAGEAESAGELAQVASRLGARSGGVDGRTLLDEDGTIKETARGLQGNGRDMDGVVRYLVRAMNEAIETEHNVHEIVYNVDLPTGDPGVEVVRGQEEQGAWNDWATWGRGLQAAVNERNAAGNQVNHLMPLEVHGEIMSNPTTRSIPSSGTNAQGGPIFQIPESIAEEIRKEHLEVVVDSAKSSHSHVNEAINSYRYQLAQYGQELGDLGYDLSEGPFGLFMTQQQAAYEGRQLAAELAKAHPDKNLILMWTEGLEAIARGIYEDMRDGGTPSRPMTAQERAFLQTFYGQLGIDDLAELGELAGDRDHPGQASPGLAAARRVANGLMMLTNPDAGGFDPATQGNQLPASLRHFVYDYEHTDLFAQQPFGTSPFRHEMERFNGFGDLMATASIAPGDRFATDMGHAAVEVQRQTNMQYTGSHEYTPNRFGTGLLTATALNHEASAGLLNDGDFRSTFLGTFWENSNGAAALIHSGTHVPQGVDPNSAAARPYVQAAYNLLHDAPDSKGVITGDLVPPNAKALGYVDQSALQRAIGNTALEYMDLIARPSETSGLRDPHDPDHPGGFRNLFELSTPDREALFSLMNESGSTVRNEFLDGVTTWETKTAYNAFAEPGRPHLNTALDHIGRIAGTVQHVGVVADTEGPGWASFRSMSSVSSATSAVSLFVPPTPAKLALTAGSYGLGEMIRSQIPTAAEIDARQQVALEHGDMPARTAVAQAARMAGVRMPGHQSLLDPSTPGATEADIRARVETMENNYDIKYLTEAYNDANHT